MSIFQQSLAQSEIKPTCLHKEAPITSFCTYKSCNRTLCPTCLPSHTHPTSKQIFIPIEEAWHSSQEKALKYVESLKYELEKVNIQITELEIEKSTNDDHGLIQHNRQNVKKIVKKFYESLENECQRLYSEIYDKKLDELNRIQDKIHGLYSKLTEMQVGLNKKDPKKMGNLIEDCFNLDIKQELARLSLEFKQIIENNNSKKMNKLPEITTNIEFILKNVFTESMNLLLKHSEYSQSLSTPMHINDKLLETSTISSNFIVTQPNYFEKNCQHKCLHFFNIEEKSLVVFNIEDFTPLDPLSKIKPKFEKIKLVSNTDLPIRHRSVIIPDGSIYLIGGLNKMNIVTTETFKFNWENKMLLSKADMQIARKSFGVCYLNGFISIIGGFNYNDGYLDSCEKYDVLKDKWSPIANLQGGASSSPSICIYKSGFIFKFGGLKSPRTINETIERYDIGNNSWLRFNIDIKTLNDGNETFKFLWLSSCVQINENEIVVFGGLDSKNKSSDLSFVVKVVNDEMFRVINVGTRRLKLPGGFWNSQSIVQNGRVFALQNVNLEKNEEKAWENKRNLVYFSDLMWN